MKILYFILFILMSCSSIKENRELYPLTKDIIENYEEWNKIPTLYKERVIDSILSDSLKSKYYISKMIKTIKYNKLFLFDEICGFYLKDCNYYKFSNEMLKKGSNEEFYTINTANENGFIDIIYIKVNNKWYIYNITCGRYPK